MVMSISYVITSHGYVLLPLIPRREHASGTGKGVGPEIGPLTYRSKSMLDLYSKALSMPINTWQSMQWRPGHIYQPPRLKDDHDPYSSDPNIARTT